MLSDKMKLILLKEAPNWTSLQLIEAVEQECRLAQPKAEQEPVGEMVPWPNDFESVGVDWFGKVPEVGTKLYTTPQPKQEQSVSVGEPVAWIFKPNRKLLWPHEIEQKNSLELNEYVPLYTTPQQRTWVGLTDEETNVLWMEGEANINFEHFSVVAYEIEAKLRSKNT